MCGVCVCVVWVCARGEGGACGISQYCRLQETTVDSATYGIHQYCRLHDTTVDSFTYRILLCARLISIKLDPTHTAYIGVYD